MLLRMLICSLLDWSLSVCLRLLRFLPQRLESMDTQSATLLELMFSMARSMMTLFLLPITVMYVFLLFWFMLYFYFSDLCSNYVFLLLLFIFMICLYLLHKLSASLILCVCLLCRFPMSIALTTSWLIFLRMDLYVQFVYFCLLINFP